MCWLTRPPTPTPTTPPIVARWLSCRQLLGQTVLISHHSSLNEVVRDASDNQIICLLYAVHARPVTRRRCVAPPPNCSGNAWALGPTAGATYRNRGATWQSFVGTFLSVVGGKRLQAFDFAAPPQHGAAAAARRKFCQRAAPGLTFKRGAADTTVTVNYLSSISVRRGHNRHTHVLTKRERVSSASSASVIQLHKRPGPPHNDPSSSTDFGKWNAKKDL